MSGRETVSVEEIRSALRDMLDSASLIEIAVDVSTGYADQYAGDVNQNFENLVALMKVIERKVFFARKILDRLETQFS